jgi:hypothetical protein
VDPTRWGTVLVIDGPADLLHPCQILTGLPPVPGKRRPGLANAGVGDGNGTARVIGGA